MKKATFASGEKHSLLLPLLATVLFVPLFMFRSTGPLDFWASLSLTILFLCGMAFAMDPTYRPFLRNDLRTNPGRKIIIGIVSAVILYAVFFIGDIGLRHLWPLAGRDIGFVYGFKSGTSTLRLTLLIALVIGPGEELFWRGYLQRAWQARFTTGAGWLLTAGLYAAVHLGTGNPVLVLAAAVCGLSWGFLYRKYASPLLLCVSHTLWDLLVFVVFPFSR